MNHTHFIIFKQANIMPVRTIICFLLCLSLANTQTNTSVPSSFGLLTVTHTRGGDNSQFMKYLDRYATMDCPIVTEISIVWNNEQSMQELGVFAKKALWKRPVYFYRTPNNSMNWRFKVPTESQVQVFFSIDDDITVDCEELKKGFAVWQSLAVGSIAPIVSYGPRFYEYTRTMGFQYTIGKTQNFFAIGLVGLAFISRHFMQLYYADLFQIREMRKFIVQKNNCDDIGLNWIVQYYYPEFVTQPISGNIQNISPKIGQTTGKTHYPFRSECLKRFTQIFGVSLRFAPLDDNQPGHDNRMIPLKHSLVLAKKQYIDTIILGKNANENVSATYGTDLIKKYISSVHEQNSLSKISMTQGGDVDITGKMHTLLEINRKLQKQNMGLVTDIQQCNKQISSKGTFVAKSASVEDEDSRRIQQLKRLLYLHSYGELGLVIVILVLLWVLITSQSREGSLNHSEVSTNETGLQLQ